MKTRRTRSILKKKILPGALLLTLVLGGQPIMAMAAEDVEDKSSYSVEENDNGDDYDNSDYEDPVNDYPDESWFIETYQTTFYYSESDTEVQINPDMQSFEEDDLTYTFYSWDDETNSYTFMVEQSDSAIYYVPAQNATYRCVVSQASTGREETVTLYVRPAGYGEVISDWYVETTAPVYFYNNGTTEVILAAEIANWDDEQLLFDWYKYDQEFGEYILLADNTVNDTYLVSPKEAIYRCIVHEEASGLSGTINFSVEYEEDFSEEDGWGKLPENPGQISTDETKDVSIAPEDHSVTFEFTPETSGTYIFKAIQNSEESYDTYGRILELNEDGTVNVMIEDDDSAGNLQFMIKFDAVSGHTYYLQSKLLNPEEVTVSFAVTVYENDIAGISFEPAKPYTLIENIEGVENLYENPEEGISETYFHYNLPDFQDGDKLIVSKTNGTDISYIYNSNEYSFENGAGEVILNGAIKKSDNQYYDHWTRDKENYFQISYLEYSLNLPVTLVESPVESITFEPAVPYQLFENVNCEYETDENGIEYCYYYGPYFEIDDSLTVTYKDGTADTYIYNYSEEGQPSFTSSNGDIIVVADGGDESPAVIRMFNDQIVNHWTIGTDNYVKISYMGETCKVPVAIKENPVSKIEFIPVEEYTLYENLDGEWGDYEVYDDETGDMFQKSYFCYYLPSFNEGDRLIITDNHQKETVYTYRPLDDEDCYFLTEQNEGLIRDFFSTTDHQGGAEQWTVGSEYYFQINYFGQSCDVPVRIIEDPVKSIEFSPGKDKICYEHSNGYWGKREVWNDENDTYDEVDYYYYWIPQWAEGDQLTVHYTNGNTSVFEWSEEESGFINDQGESLPVSRNEQEEYDRYNLHHFSYQNSEPWEIGNDNSYYVAYYNHIVNVPVTLKENPVESISYIPIEEYTVGKETHGNWGHGWRYDGVEDTEFDFFYYWVDDIFEARDGDKLIVNTNDGKTTIYVYSSKTGNYESDSGEIIDSNYWHLSGYGEQENAPWEMGKENYFQFYYMGKECNIPVTITDHEHILIYQPAVEATLEEEGMIAHWRCEECGKTFADENGETELFGEEIYTEKLRDIKFTSIQALSDESYTGKKIEPVPVVTYVGNKLALNKDYVVEYENNLLPGTATVRIIGAGLYGGTAAVTFRINPAAPKNVSFSGRASDALRINWSKESSAAGYIIDQNVNGNWKRIARIGDANTTDFRVEKLLPSTEYQFRIQSFAFDGNTPLYSSYETVAGKTLPSDITGFKIFNTTKDTVSLTWDKNESAAGYIIEQLVNNVWSRIARIASNLTVSQEVTGLQPATDYQFRIQSFSFDGSNPLYTPFTKAVTGTTKPVVATPKAVSGVKIGGRADDALRIIWDKDNNAEGYIIEQKQNGSWVRIARIGDNKTTTYRVEKLTPSTSYEFRIQAFTFDNNMPLYGPFTTISGATIPSKVTGVKIGGRAPDAIRLNWNKNDSALGYIIDQYENGKWTRIARIGNNSTVTYRVEKLTSSTTYQFRIQAFGFEGATPLYSSYTMISGKTNPQAVSGVKIAGRAEDALRINWTKNEDASGYIIEENVGGTWKRIERIGDANTTTYRVESLKASTTYQFRIQAFGFEGTNALYSTYMSISGRTNPQAVTNVRIAGWAKDALRINWTKNPNASGYIIEKYDNGKWVRIARIADPNTETFRVEKLSAGTTYQFRIQAFDFDGKVPLYSPFVSVSGTTIK